MLKRIAYTTLCSLTVCFLLMWYFCLPTELFKNPHSSVILDREGHLLAAKTAIDGQWRFPPSDSIPYKFATCLVQFEDKGFYSHCGVSLRAIIRALGQNIKNGQIISGASTLTMQAMRMARRNQRRTFWQKLIETFWAVRSEWRFSKEEILNLYISNAPFGGNVVGLDAASWRYFKKPAFALTWAESAGLAVLPNAPGLIYPGRNPIALLRKRNKLLKALYLGQVIDQETYELSLLEALPGIPFTLPNEASHLLASKTQAKIIRSTIDGDLQSQCTTLLTNRLHSLSENHIYNAALLLADTKTGEVLAYVGNGRGENPDRGMANDMIMAKRSSGSILKPLLYAAMLSEGELSPRQLIPDIPTQYGDFAPKNYDGSYSGAVPAEEALARSLNIPAVRMLQSFGVPRFHKVLQDCGFRSIIHSPSHYGLSLILGGAEVSLWDLVNAYRQLGVRVSNFPQRDTTSIYFEGDQHSDLAHWPIDAGSAWTCLEAMSQVIRPDELASWEIFGGSQKIAWKTGTSFGFRDAWAVGVTPKYTVGIWVGNASGEGRPGITGLNAAAPLLFDVFNSLPASKWFKTPKTELVETEICAHSGMRRSEKCAAIASQLIPKTALSTGKCIYCSWVYLTENGEHRGTALCLGEGPIRRTSYFSLPPLQAWFYRRNHSMYQELPPWHPDCIVHQRQDDIQLIYPREASTVFIPKDLNGEEEKIVMKAAHRRRSAIIYWHLDEKYLGESEGFHHMEVYLLAGVHTLSLVDDEGEVYSSTIRALGK